MSRDLPRAIALMGPTASGKTRLAVELAQALDGEIISVDSSLVYRGMDIGTAKPSLDERQGVPHHLIDLIEPAESFSTGEFRRRALALMADIHQRGRLPILAGGTMLYFNCLFNGLASLPEADEETRRRIDAEARDLGWEHMHRLLAKVDPTAASRIHPNDPQRIQRALEVYRLTGVPISELQRQAKTEAPPFEFIRLVLAPSDRERLGRRIRERFQLMLEMGLMEEVRALYRRGDLNLDMPSMRAVGYRQTWLHLLGELAYEEMIERAVIATRQFAKRQYTWLRRETSATWFDNEQQDLLGNTLTLIRGQTDCG